MFETPFYEYEVAECYRPEVSSVCRHFSQKGFRLHSFEVMGATREFAILIFEKPRIEQQKGEESTPIAMKG